MTSVTTMAARVGFHTSLLPTLSLREGPSQLEENQFSVVADRSCQNSSGEYKGGEI